jgi:serine protease Do
MKQVLLGCILFLLFVSLLEASDFDPKWIFKETSKSVVLVVGHDPGVKSESMGSGSIIRKDGLVLSNSHVVFNREANKPYERIRVYLKPDILTGSLKKDTRRGYDAVILGYDNSLDLALLKIQGNFASSIPFLQFADAKKAQIGEPVVAIGHPEKGGLWSLTRGTISSWREDFEGVKNKTVFQTDAAINRGNSGGPLLNGNGNIVGINSNFHRKGVGGLTIIGINFSIQSNVAVNWLRSRGYSFSYPNTSLPIQETSEITFPRTGIVPIPEQSRKPVGPRKEIVKPALEAYQEPALLTKPRPFRKNELFNEVEMELEDMMDEMRGKLPQNR